VTAHVSTTGCLSVTPSVAASCWHTIHSGSPLWTSFWVATPSYCLPVWSRPTRTIALTLRNGIAMGRRYLPIPQFSWLHIV
jgi:hypothetical protein